MDKLKITLPEHLRNMQESIVIRVLKDRNATHPDAGGMELLRAAAYRKAIQQDKEHSYHRRSYEPTYLNRSKDKSELYLDTFDNLGARWIKNATDIFNPRDGHTDWYADEAGYATIKGMVLCMTRHGAPDDNGEELGKRDRVVYLIGTQHSEGDGVTLSTEIYRSQEQAAFAADGMAEAEAERCREDDHEQRIEHQKEELAEQIKIARTKCLKLLRDMRPIRKGMMRVPESVCEALHEQVSSYLNEISTARKEIGELI